MSNILIAVLPQMGHVGPTLEIASNLMRRGHRVIYLLSENFRTLIEGVGAELFLPISCGKSNSVNERSNAEPVPSVGSILELIESLQIDLLLLDIVLAQHYLELECLSIGKRLIFSTSLLDWHETFFAQEEPLLMLCPDLFEIPKFRHLRPNLIYTEPAVSPVPQAVEIEWSASKRPLILCTFGTQSLRHTRLADHYQIIFSIAEQNKNCDFLLAAEYPQFLPCTHSPNNLQVRPMLPQRFLLSRCAAFITHGGLGGIKEAILAGVPMIVLPSFGDQFFNAMRVRYHGLGDGLFEDSQTSKVATQILKKSLDGEFQKNIDIMQAYFLECAQKHRSIDLIESLIN